MRKKMLEGGRKRTQNCLLSTDLTNPTNLWPIPHKKPTNHTNHTNPDVKRKELIIVYLEIGIGVIGVIGRLFEWDWSGIGRIGEIGRQKVCSLPNAAILNARACNDGLVAEKKFEGVVHAAASHSLRHAQTSPRIRC